MSADLGLWSVHLTQQLLVIQAMSGAPLEVSGWLLLFLTSLTPDPTIYICPLLPLKTDLLPPWPGVSAGAFQQ